MGTLNPGRTLREPLDNPGVDPHRRSKSLAASWISKALVEIFQSLFRDSNTEVMGIAARLLGAVGQPIGCRSRDFRS
jgi:hypothetical protein